jgi:hypothetical protein
MGREIKFKPATFYLGIADHLAKAVEGLMPGDQGDQGRGQVKNLEELEPARTIHAHETRVLRSDTVEEGEQPKQQTAGSENQDDHDLSKS